MKKTLTLIAALAALALSSCKKEKKTNVVVKEISDIIFTVASPDTKALKSNWETGDEIMIFFEYKTDVGQQAKIRYNGSTWQLVQKPSNLSYAPGKNVGQYSAIHYPGEIVYNGQNDDYKKIMNYRAGVVLWENNNRFNVNSEGVIELGTISLTKMGNKTFQVVVPWISAEDNYTLSVTCNGQVESAERNCGNYSNSYVEKYCPYPNSRGGLTYGGGINNTYGVENASGTEFYFWLRSTTPSAAATSAYKYVFALSDGTQLYYYTIPKGSSKTIADKSAIKLPRFDGKTTNTHWKTTLE